MEFIGFTTITAISVVFKIEIDKLKGYDAFSCFSCFNAPMLWLLDEFFVSLIQMPSTCFNLDFIRNNVTQD